MTGHARGFVAARLAGCAVLLWKTAPRLYIFGLAFAAGAGLATLPLGLGDTDVWYHLNSGRHTIQNGWPPTESFFSFLEPPRVWTDYYWLFQVVAYLVYSGFSFPGLILLPAIAYLGTLYFIYRLLIARGAALSTFVVAVFALYAVFLLPRAGLVRPHIITYFMIVALLFICERPSSRAYLFLPLLALLWVNFHGVSYPVLLLITAAYAAEFLVSHIRSGERMTARDVGYLATVVFAMYAVYATPHGTSLLGTPFAPIGPAAYYIAELRRPVLEEFLTFNLSTSTWSFTYPTIRNVLVVLVSVALLRSLLSRTLRLSHALLALGGFVLLTRGSRFSYEFLLLSVPLIASSPYRLPSLPVATRAVVALGGVVAAALPFTFLYAHFGHAPAYPVSQSHLPHGVVRFLQQVDVGGRLLNHPNNGGYFQWALNERYKIYMDMEVPFLFSNEDFYLVSQAYADPTVLKRLVDQYRPDFIAVPLWNRAGRTLLSAGAPTYALVFVDDVEALYVDRLQHPEIARRHGMTVIDPFALPTVGVGVGASAVRPMLDEAERLLEIHPESGIANHIAGLVRHDQGQHDIALEHAHRIIANHPQTASGHLLRAEVMRSLGRLPEAVAAYEAAIERADAAAKIAISKRLGAMLFDGGVPEQAYRILRRVTNVFSMDTTHQDLYYLGAAMFETGRVDQAAVILRFGFHKVSESDDVWIHRFREYLERLREAT